MNETQVTETYYSNGGKEYNCLLYWNFYNPMFSIQNLERTAAAFMRRAFECAEDIAHYEQTEQQHKHSPEYLRGRITYLEEQFSWYANEADLAYSQLERRWQELKGRG